MASPKDIPNKDEEGEKRTLNIIVGHLIFSRDINIDIICELSDPCIQPNYKWIHHIHPPTSQFFNKSLTYCEYEMKWNVALKLWVQ